MALDRKMCLPVLMCLSAGLAGQACADDWQGRDKALHFAGTAGLSAALTLGTRSLEIGFWSGVAAAKEAWDQQQQVNSASGKDFVWSVAGAYVGTQGGGWILKRSGGQTVVGYGWRF